MTTKRMAGSGQWLKYCKTKNSKFKLVVLDQIKRVKILLNFFRNYDKQNKDRNYILHKKWIKDNTIF